MVSSLNTKMLTNHHKCIEKLWYCTCIRTLTK